MKTWLQKKKAFLFLCIIIGALHIGLVLFFGMQKEGFHEDELYSFATSAGVMNSTPTDNYIWKSGYQIQQEFMVVEGHEFAFSEVIQNQAEDVHPPLFYLVLNMVMSLFPGHFYKWFGIGLNLLYSLVTYGGIIFFFYQLDKSRQRVWYALTAGSVYAISPAVISNVMLVRMYALSGMWTVLYACLFLVLIQNYQCNHKRFVLYIFCGAGICYLAFLTHYFSLLLPFFFTLGYCIYALLQKKKIVRMLLYGVSMLAAIGLSILAYPESMEHIFYGYRGTGVQTSLANAELIGMTKTFLTILNDKVFAGLLVPIAVLTGVALLIAVILLFRKRAAMTADTKVTVYGFSVSFTACIICVYFLTKSALLVGDASCRFFYPVLVLLLPLGAYCVCKVFYRSMQEAFREKGQVAFRYLMTALSVIVMIPGLVGFARGDVLFLYPENAEAKAIIQQYQEYPAVMIYDRNAPFRSWYFADQLWMFSQVYYLDSEHFLATFEDEILETTEKVVVYVDAPPEYLEKLQDMNPALENITTLWKNNYFYVYGLE